jgi:hypothetical protein
MLPDKDKEIIRYRIYHIERGLYFDKGKWTKEGKMYPLRDLKYTLKYNYGNYRMPEDKIEIHAYDCTHYSEVWYDGKMINI